VWHKLVTNVASVVTLNFVLGTNQSLRSKECLTRKPRKTIYYAKSGIRITSQTSMIVGNVTYKSANTALSN